MREARRLIERLPFCLGAMQRWGFSFTLMTWMLFIAFAEVAQAEGDKTAEQESLERRQRIELLSFFLKDPKDAKLPKAAMAVEIYNQGVRHFQNGEYDLARHALKQSLAQDDMNSLAYELLGDIDNLQQNLSGAKSNYEIAYNSNPDQRVKSKIEKLRKETHVEKKLSTYQEEHFIIKYKKEEKSYEGFELRDLLRKTYRQVSSDFAYYFKHKVVVLLYDHQDFKKITDKPHWVAGLYDGKVRMPINRKGFDRLDLEALTTHEVTHAFVAGMSSGRAPAWINEGLAEFEENKVRKANMRIFYDAVRKGTLFPLHQLMYQGSTMSIQNRRRVSLFYQQSFHMVSYLIKRYGMFRVKKILEEYGKGKDSDQAIRAVLKISINRLEKVWKETISK